MLKIDPQVVAKGLLVGLSPFLPPFHFIDDLILSDAEYHYVECYWSHFSRAYNYKGAVKVVQISSYRPNRRGQKLPLAGDNQALNISRNQLSAFTQTVNAYELVNVRCNNYSMYLIDTPGFSDVKISAVEIVKMVRSWLDDNDQRYLDHILFLIPITTRRLTGNMRKTIDIVRKFMRPTEGNRLTNLTFVTTMWDTLYTKDMLQHAEGCFNQMRDRYLKDFVEEGANMTRFMNTQESALQTLDRWFIGRPCTIPHTYHRFLSLHQDLHERIGNALQEKEVLEIDLSDPETQADDTLVSVLQDRLSENKETLAKFAVQLLDVGHSPSEMQEAGRKLRKAIVAANFLAASYQEQFCLWDAEEEAQHAVNMRPEPSPSPTSKSFKFNSLVALATQVLCITIIDFFSLYLTRILNHGFLQFTALAPVVDGRAGFGVRIGWSARNEGDIHGVPSRTSICIRLDYSFARNQDMDGLYRMRAIKVIRASHHLAK
ncbi:hypothetical protein CVT24_006819 [Panaeolus cyanescens]|uniref:G domain-containing protein n=1 Tax=Panaeolus cyanescens TaxID=181874 RepID=A0A409WC58_9AGAR|nr:hypothetical protein CVT24_006819 [Panaeolus cyanescens]